MTEGEWLLLIAVAIVVLALSWDNRHYPHLWSDEDEGQDDPSDGP